MEIFYDVQGVPILSRFEQAVDDLQTLEMVPAVAQRVIAMTTDPDCQTTELERAVSADAGLAARVLRLAATPLFLARPARTLLSAISAIGMTDLRRLVLAASLPGAGVARGFAADLWRYALQSAHLAQLLAPRARLTGGPDPFLCGLLHEVGTMALLRLMRSDYPRVLGRPGADEQCAPERTMLGFDHADFGAVVAARWRLFPELEVVVQLHHDISLLDRLALPRMTDRAVRLVSLTRLALVHPDSPLLPDLADSLGVSLQAVAKEVEVSAAMTRTIVSTLS